MSVALSKPRIGTGLTVEQALAQRRSVQTFAARSVAHKDVLGPTIYASDVAQSGTLRSRVVVIFADLNISYG